LISTQKSLKAQASKETALGQGHLSAFFEVEKLAMFGTRLARQLNLTASAVSQLESNFNISPTSLLDIFPTANYLFFIQTDHLE